MKKLSMNARVALGVLTSLAGAPAARADAPAPPPVFARCAVCHNAAKGAEVKVGPNLWGIYGAKAAHAKFSYSPAFKAAANWKWTPEMLDKWLTGPMTMVPGTYMSFPGIKDPAKRAEVIAYLKQLH